MQNKASIVQQKFKTKEWGTCNCNNKGHTFSIIIRGALLVMYNPCMGTLSLQALKRASAHDPRQSHDCHESQPPYLLLGPIRVSVRALKSRPWSSKGTRYGSPYSSCTSDWFRRFCTVVQNNVYFLHQECYQVEFLHYGYRDIRKQNCQWWMSHEEGELNCCLFSILSHDLSANRNLPLMQQYHTSSLMWGLTSIPLHSCEDWHVRTDQHTSALINMSGLTCQDWPPYLCTHQHVVT
jgi:hypothetical protein